jgi:hypothetical protein
MANYIGYQIFVINPGADTERFLHYSERPAVNHPFVGCLVWYQQQNINKVASNRRISLKELSLRINNPK